MKDPKGNELKFILLQVLEKDEQGPTLMRARRDHERIDLANDPHRTFLIVWAPVDSALGEIQLDDLYRDLQDLKAREKTAVRETSDLRTQLHFAQRELDALEADNKTKTEALRVLQKERDPDRMEALIRERITVAMVKLDDEMISTRAERDHLRGEAAELRAAKKRLKEVNETLRNKLNAPR